MRKNFAISDLMAISMFMMALVIGSGITFIILNAQIAGNQSVSTAQEFSIVTVTQNFTITVTQGGSSVTIPTVTILGNGDGAYFSPLAVTVVIGVNNTVKWINNGTLTHTVTAKDKSFNSGNLKPGASWNYTFTTPGNYSYYCVYHPWMIGSVQVESE